MPWDFSQASKDSSKNEKSINQLIPKSKRKLGIIIRWNNSIKVTLSYENERTLKNLINFENHKKVTLGHATW